MDKSCKQLQVVLILEARTTGHDLTEYIPCSFDVNCGFWCCATIQQYTTFTIPIGGEGSLQFSNDGSCDTRHQLVIVNGIFAEVVAFDQVLRACIADLPVDDDDLAVIAQVDAGVLLPKEVQRQGYVMFDASRREPLLHYLEVRVFARP